MSTDKATTAALRPMLPADVPVLAAIFQAAIDQLAEDDYDESQREVWAAAADDEAAFGARLMKAVTIVAVVRGAPVGFVSLAGSDLIDMLYVYPPVARQGIASLLVDALEKLAKGRGATTLTVEASDTARPFFEGRGYVAQSRQTVAIGDVWLGNTRMQRTLG